MREPLEFEWDGSGTQRLSSARRLVWGRCRSRAVSKEIRIGRIALLLRVKRCRLRSGHRVSGEFELASIKANARRDMHEHQRGGVLVRWAP